MKIYEEILQLIIQINIIEKIKREDLLDNFKFIANIINEKRI